MSMLAEVAPGCWIDAGHVRYVNEAPGGGSNVGVAGMDGRVDQMASSFEPGEVAARVNAARAAIAAPPQEPTP